jgi:hypothetical protein
MKQQKKMCKTLKNIIICRKMMIKSAMFDKEKHSFFFLCFSSAFVRYDNYIFKLKEKKIHI